MNKLFLNLILIPLSSSFLASCSTVIPSNNPSQEQQNSIVVSEIAPNTKMALMSGAPAADTGPLGGNLQALMGKSDKYKLSRALDGGLGKSTQWNSAEHHIHYTVTPTQKMTIEGNPFCRKYSVTAVRGESSQTMAGVACLESDGEWHPK